MVYRHIQFYGKSMAAIDPMRALIPFNLLVNIDLRSQLALYNDNCNVFFFQNKVLHRRIRQLIYISGNHGKVRSMWLIEYLSWFY